MKAAQHVRVTSAVVGLLLAVVLAGVTTPALAATQSPTWALLQTIASSGDVHSPTFITPLRGWAVVGNRLLHTNDGGLSWSVFLPAEWTSRLPSALSFADPLHGWAVGEGFVLATADGGNHWTVQAAQVASSTTWLDVQAIDSTHAFAVSASGIVLGTEDGGATWTRRAEVAGGTLQALHFADAAHGSAVGADSNGNALILITADAGATWSPHAAPAQAVLSAVWFTDATHGWAAGVGGVVRTTDGGATWSTAGSPLGLSPGSQRASLAFVSATHGFLGVGKSDSGNPCLWETTDGGVTWLESTPIDEPAGVNGLAMLDSTHVLATGVSLPAENVLTAGRIWAWSPPATVASAAAPKIALAINSTSTAKNQVAHKKAKKVAKKHARKHAAKRTRHAKR